MTHSETFSSETSEPIQQQKMPEMADGNCRDSNATTSRDQRHSAAWKSLHLTHEPLYAAFN